jgi:hypothetical protein
VGRVRSSRRQVASAQDALNQTGEDFKKNKRRRKGNKLEMSNYGRPLPSHLRNQSLGGAAQQSPVLLARIAEKKAELASLKDLQALSGGLADQMQMLADKLQTLSSGTEGVLCRPIFPTGSY